MMSHGQPRPAIGIITVGDELLAGRVVDTNAAYLAAGLTAAGYRVSFQLSVGDGVGELRGALLQHSAAVDGLVISGGLGPTEDDRTRSEVADARAVELVEHAEVWEAIRRWLVERGVRPSPRNRRQARFPAGAAVIANPRGTAPAFRLDAPAGPWWVLPGVPAELEPLFDEAVLPELRERVPGSAPVRQRVLRFFGVPESTLDEWFMAELPSTDGYHVRVSRGELEVRLPEAVDLAPAAQARFGEHFLGEGERDLSGRVIDTARETGVRFATAESCTGGLLGARLTEIAGASRVYLGGWVVYSDELKEDALGVPGALLASHGAVSAEVAARLAEGARSRSTATVAVAVTGIAGPGGGSDAKPVGTVFLGLVREEGTWTRRLELRGGRSRVRSRSAAWALFGLLGALRGSGLEGWTRV